MRKEQERLDEEWDARDEWEFGPYRNRHRNDWEW